ncbi:MAG: nitrous oxide-stimulated promoter family protein [Bacteroidetes bacterium]|nr:nitrous oxide-stimulated promoter family protein [Bacteroidota bacterium]
MAGGNKLEKRTITAMIRIYCRSVHKSTELCGLCRDLNEYALKRIEQCVHGMDKPVCQKCQVHCYSPLMREEIKKVMRVAGPQMMLRHPVLSLKHFIREWKGMSDFGCRISDI